MRYLLYYLLLLPLWGRAQSTPEALSDRIGQRVHLGDFDGAAELIDSLRQHPATDEATHVYLTDQLAGMLLKSHGNLDRARRLLRGNTARVRATFGTERPPYAFHHLTLAKVLHAQQDSLDVALHHAEIAYRSYLAHVGPQDPQTTVAVHTLIDLLRNLDRPEEALTYHPAAMYAAIQSGGEGSVAHGTLLMEWGVTLRHTGDYAAAATKIRRGMALFIDRIAPWKPQVAFAHYERGQLEMLLGNYAAAETHLRRAYTLSQRYHHPTQPGYVSAPLLLGDLFNVTERPDSAAHYHTLAYRLARRFRSPDDRTYRATQYARARVHLWHGRLDAADTLLRSLIRWYERQPDRPGAYGHIAPYELATRVAYRRGDYPTARTYYMAAYRDALVTHGPDALFTAELMQTGAFIFYHLDAPHAAAATTLQSYRRYRRAFERTYSDFSPETQRRLGRRYGDFDARFFNYLDLHPTDSLRRAAYDFALWRRGLFLRDRQQFRTDSTAALYRAWQTAGNDLARSFLRTDRPASERDRLRVRYDSLGAELSRGAAPAVVPDWQTIRDALRPGEAALEIVRYEGWSNYSDTSGTEAHYLALLMRPDSAAPTALRLFDAARMPAPGRTRTLYAPGGGPQSLRTSVAGVLLPHLEGVNRLYVAPDGIFHRINLGAIPADDSTTLGERLAIHRVLSTGNLVRHQPPTPTEAGRALVFGGIDFGTAVPAGTSPGLAQRAGGAGGWSPLPWSAREAAAVGEHLSRHYSVAVRTDGAATETTFKETAPGARVLHLATHGYFFPTARPDRAGLRAAEHPLLRSGLILAGANAAWRGQPDTTQTEDGILTALEIGQLDLRGTELVVLSACDTGLGDIEGSEGVYGLQRAFKAAGARYVLMSLWRVDDRRTYEFMEQFYRHWLAEGHSIPESHRRAQRWMRERATGPFQPRDWAGFVLLE